MKIIYLILLITTISVNTFAQWTQVGTNLGTTSLSSAPSLIFNPSTNEPYVAYSDAAADALVIQKFNGTSWTQVGTNLGTLTRTPSLIFNPSTNEPYVAYPDGAANAFVIQKFNGTSWTQVGTNLGSTSLSSAPSLIFNPSTNEPYVAYRDEAANAFVIQKFNGTSWTQVGTNLGSTPTSAPSLIFNPSTNEPYVAYPDGAANAVVIQKFNGTSWTQVGANLGFTSTSAPSLIFNPSTNEPYVAYPDEAAIVIQKFNGTSWTQVGTNLGFTSSSAPSLIFNPSTNEPYVAYPDGAANAIVIQKFNGTSWTQVGTNLGFTSNGTPSLIFNPSTNEPYVAYPDEAANAFVIQKYICPAAAWTDTRTECNSYTWIDGNNYTSSNNTATFNIVGGAANGCDSLVTIDLTINNVSDITTTTSGVTISATNTGATYQWLDCDNNNAIITGETGQSYTATVNGNYAVELTENGCIDTSACVAITTVGIIENSFGNDLNIYPNPTSGNFSIDLGINYKSTVVTLTDLNGNLIQSKQYINSGLLNLKIDEPAGVYLLLIESTNNKVIIRLVKE
jgi:lysozyme family protein